MTAAGRTALYPVTLRVEGRPCLVVGGGRVATRKVAGLAACGARVTVVAPDIGETIATLAGSPELAAPGSVALRCRPYRAGEAAGFRLVVTATGLPEVDRTVAADADAAGVWVNCADDPEHCSFLLPSVHRDGPVSIAVSTGGASPALASWLRRRVEQALGQIGGPIGGQIGALATLLEEARRRLQAEGRATDTVNWVRLLDGPLPELVDAGRTEEARHLIAGAAGLRAGPP